MLVSQVRDQQPAREGEHAKGDPQPLGAAFGSQHRRHFIVHHLEIPRINLPWRFSFHDLPSKATSC
jgi:hypothetical protein